VGSFAEKWRGSLRDGRATPHPSRIEKCERMRAPAENRRIAENRRLSPAFA
jgi:hypothetical protein